ncbi:MAG: hypothetical protein NTW38_05530 [Candidatus Aminicenantes bacterium]|nr:hypothetical protein [Candidatus Aminicenantes bacterium]
MKIKRVLIVILALLAASVPAIRAAQAEPGVTSKPEAAVRNPRPGLMIFGRYGSFRPSSDIFKEVYGPGPVFSGEIRIRLIGGLHLSLEAGSFKKTGKLTVTKEATKMTIFPVEAMAIYHFLPGKITPYAGAGPHLVSYRESNILGSVSGSGLGFAVCGGVAARWRFIGLDARVKYASVKDTPVKDKVDFSGLTFDIALGLFLGRSLN